MWENLYCIIVTCSHVYHRISFEVLTVYITHADLVDVLVTMIIVWDSVLRRCALQLAVLLDCWQLCMSLTVVCIMLCIAAFLIV